MAYCPLCEKKFKSINGLHGHFRFKHKIEYESGRPARETAFTKAIENQINRDRINRRQREDDAMMREMRELENSRSRNERIEEKKKSNFVKKVGVKKVELGR